MITLPAISHDDRVQSLVNEYLSKGYSVLVEPRGAELPDFLRGYRPDIIASKEDDHVILELKGGGKIRRSEYWTEVEERAASAGWRFVIVPAVQDERFTIKSLDNSEIRQRVATSRSLSSQGEHEAALVLLSSAAEAALRSTAAVEEVKVHNEGPGAMASALYSDGLLDRSDYDRLTSLFSQRNSLVHGYEYKPVGGALLSEMADLVEKLVGTASP